MTFDDRASVALAEALGALEAAARDHKRSASHHRNTARKLMQAREQLQRECDRLGISLTIADGGTGVRPHS